MLNDKENFKLVSNWENPPIQWRSIQQKIYFSGVAFGVWDLRSWFVGRIQYLFGDISPESLFEIENDNIITGFVVLDKKIPIAAIRLKVEQDDCVIVGRIIRLELQKKVCNFIEEYLSESPKKLALVHLKGRSRSFGWDGEKCLEGKIIFWDRKIRELISRERYLLDSDVQHKSLRYVIRSVDDIIATNNRNLQLRVGLILMHYIDAKFAVINKPRQSFLALIIELTESTHRLFSEVYPTDSPLLLRFQMVQLIVNKEAAIQDSLEAVVTSIVTAIGRVKPDIKILIDLFFMIDQCLEAGSLSSAKRLIELGETWINSKDYVDAREHTYPIYEMKHRYLALAGDKLGCLSILKELPSIKKPWPEIMGNVPKKWQASIKQTMYYFGSLNSGPISIDIETLRTYRAMNLPVVVKSKDQLDEDTLMRIQKLGVDLTIDAKIYKGLSPARARWRTYARWK